MRGCMCVVGRFVHKIFQFVYVLHMYMSSLPQSSVVRWRNNVPQLCIVMIF